LSLKRYRRLNAINDPFLCLCLSKGVLDGGAADGEENFWELNFQRK